jgi:enolase
MVVNGVQDIDSKLTEYFSKQNPEEIGQNVIKVVSEGVVFAAAACHERVNLF